jgi:DNA-binding MarR family transcriptional regulator
VPAAHASRAGAGRADPARGVRPQAPGARRAGHGDRAGERGADQSIGTTLAGLQTRGLLERRPDPGDGRRSILAITQAGRATLADKHNARTEQLVKALSAGFTPSELRQLMASAPLIERLAQAI